jgi:hypothetical protein
VLGREAASTFYYAIGKKNHIDPEQFKRIPLKVLQLLKELLGGPAFGILEPAIFAEVKNAFDIQTKPRDFGHLIELAKKNYLRFSL